MYLCIKDICPSADEVIIVTSSLMKDMNSKTDLYRSNSVRVLCKIIDSQLLMQVCVIRLLSPSHPPWSCAATAFPSRQHQQMAMHPTYTWPVCCAQIERYVKQAIVDKSAVVASASLVSALHLLSNNTETVKRWINEIQEAAQNKNSMVSDCLA